MAKLRAQDVLAVARRLADEVLFPDATGWTARAMADARAAASELALRAATALAVRDGAPPSPRTATPSGWPARRCSCWCSGPGRALRARSCSGSVPWLWSVMIVPVLSPPGGRNRHQADRARQLR